MRYKLLFIFFSITFIIFADTELLKAINNLSVADVDKILRSGVDPNTKTDSGFSPLAFAAEDNLLQISELLIEYGADINAVTNNGWSILHVALSRKSGDVAKSILENGANIFSVTDNGMTTLMLATNMDSYFINFFINNGVPINSTNEKGFSALHYAILNKDMHSIKILIDNGANKNNIKLFIDDLLLNKYPAYRNIFFSDNDLDYIFSLIQN